MNWLLANKDTKLLHDGIVRNDQYKANCSIGVEHIWLEIPEGIAHGNCKVDETEGVFSLVDGSADKAGPSWDAMRAERNAKLAACDWTQMADSPLGETPKAAWASYRQSLRDLPANTSDPDSVTWPSQP